MIDTPRIKEFISKESSGFIDFALLYGSIVKGNFNEESDIDIGVFVNEGYFCWNSK